MSFSGHQPADSDEERIGGLSRIVATNVQKISRNVNEIQKMVSQLGSAPDLDTFRTKLPGVQELTRELTRDSNNSLKELAQLPQMMTAMASTQHIPRHPTILNNSNVFNRNTSPQFSVDRFMSRNSLLTAKSNFYEGKTVFGGANMSRSARLAGTTPYSLALRQQISRAVVPKVKFETTNRLIDSNEPLSRSSQRILEKLEKLSTPLNDAKRIPVSHRKNDYFLNAELLHRTTKRPKLSQTPVLSLNDPGDSLKSKKTYQLVELETIEDNRVLKTSDKTQTLINSCDKYSNESIENKSNESFVGKIMRKDSKRDDKRTIAHTVTNGDQNDNSFDLLSTAEPLSMPTSLPKFSFGSKLVEKSSDKSTTQIIKVTEDFESNYKFSKPVLKIRDQTSDSNQIDETDLKVTDKQFKFSSPQSSAITNKISIDSQKVGNKSNVLKDLVKESTVLQNIDSKQTNNLENKTEIKKKEKNSDTWVCRCLFENNSSDDKCKACNKERNNLLKPTAAPLSSKSSSTDLNANKTIPINTTANIGWGQQFKPKAGQWTCSVCCVTNDSDKSRCVACEEPKPGAILSNSTNKSSFPEPKTWKCFWCKHNNEESKTSCTSCDKFKAAIATKEDLDKLYGEPEIKIKFGISEDQSSAKNDKKVVENTEVLSKPMSTGFLPKPTENSSEKTTNTFVFGSTSLKVPSVSNDITSQKLFNFGEPSAPTKSTVEFKAPEKSTTNIADIFGSNKTTNSSVPFSFGAVPSITSQNSSKEKQDVNLKTKTSSESTFSFGINEDLDKRKSEKRKSIDLEKKTENSSETTEELSTNQSKISFQIPKTTEEKTIFKGFTSTTSGSLFGSTTSSATFALPTVTTTASITSFKDNKFSPLKSTETQNKGTGFLFGAPATTTSSNTSFSSPFSLTNSFSSGQTLTSNSGQNSTEGNGVKSMFSMPASSIKPLISSQPNPLVSSPSVTSSAPLNSITSSSPKGLVFGNSNQTLQSFTSQPSIATTKPNFSFNLGANSTSANTTAPTAESTAFGSNSTALFGSNPNKGFSFGNPTLSSSQTPSFSFTNPNNTTSADTNSKASNLFQFGGQTTDQFSSSSAPKTLNNTNNNLKTSSQFSFGSLSSNPSTGPTNNNNFFANAITSAPNSLSFTQLGSGIGTGAAAPATNSSPFTFGGFNSSTPSMPQMQSQPQQQQQQSQTSLPPPQFNFSAQPSFDFASMTNPDNTPSTGPVFQFSADNTTQAVAPNRNIKRAKRRLPNTTT